MNVLGLGAVKRGLAAAGAFSLAVNVLMLSIPLYMTAIYGRVLTSHSSETLVVLTVAAVGALVLCSLLETVRQVLLNRTGLRLEVLLGAKALKASVAEGNGQGLQALRDLSQVRNFIASPAMAGLLDAPTAPLYLALIYLVHPSLGLIVLAAGLAMVAISLLNQWLTRAFHERAATHAMSALLSAQAQARSADVMRAMGMFPNALAAWGADNGKALASADAAGRRTAALAGISRLLRSSLQVAVLGYGAYLVLGDGMLNPGIIFAASVISGRALAPVDQIIGGWQGIVSARQAWKRLAGALRDDEATPDRMTLPAPRASIAAEGLLYRSEQAAILKGISFSAEPGDIVGIIGPSGAGKSMLARLLVGAISPTAGVVRVGGDDMRHWSSEALGPFVGYLPQEVELFPATVAQNIARMDPDPDPEKVVAAAKLANCHELIQRLKDGYDTLLGPGRHVLSGGQRQRIALARAFYGSPRIVVLDEPNASLDGEGEAALVAALKSAHAAGITCIVITQRTQVLEALTKLMILRDGSIAAYGPKETVLAAARGTNVTPLHEIRARLGEAWPAAG